MNVPRFPANRARSGFRPGRTTYLCDTCGRRTRETPTQGIGSHLCPQCYELSGLENSVADGVLTHSEIATDRDALRRCVSGNAAFSLNVWRAVPNTLTSLKTHMDEAPAI